MRRISLNFCRPPFVTGDNQALAKAAILCGSRKSQRLAWNDDFWFLDVRNNFFQWLFCAGTESGECQRCARQLNKFTSAQAF